MQAIHPSIPSITIFHNPDCGTSRNVLALIRNSGVEPEVVQYLQAPPANAQLLALAQAMGIAVRGLLRQKGTPYDTLGLADEKWTDAQLLDAIQQHPVLLQRPIVVTPLGTRICRPSEAVLKILPAPQQGAFTKEDGERVIDKDGRRVE